ncbi:hypothetical protein FACS1894132_01100 [Clostridia bacterium]|nr:hypothetical protein FACS1894132_01100 [Clostridia bacterium]
MDVKRINELAHLAKQRELTDDEKKEREVLRNEYREAMKRSLLGELENAGIIGEAE